METKLEQFPLENVLSLSRSICVVCVVCMSLTYNRLFLIRKIIYNKKSKITENLSVVVAELEKKSEEDRR